MDAAGDFAAQFSRTGLDSVERLTPVTINGTDGTTVVRPSTVLAERLTIITHSWNSKERDSL